MAASKAVIAGGVAVDVSDDAWRRIRAAHLGLSRHDWRFREAAAADEECLRRSTYAQLDEPNRLIKYRQQSWPTFVDRAWSEELSRIGVGISRLIRSVPSRVFGNDPERISEFYGLDDPVLAEMLVAPPTGIESALSRGDFIATEAGLKCIEFNFSPSLAGWETDILTRIHLRFAPTARFIRESGLSVSSTNTMAVLFSHILSQVLDELGCADREVNTAFVFTDGHPHTSDSTGFDYLSSVYAAACADRGVGGRLAVCYMRDLALRQGQLRLSDLPVRAVIELCEQLTSPEVYRCFKAGAVCLLNGPMTALLTSKRNLALLSELADTGIFDDEERELIQRHVPWTRLVSAGHVTFEGRREYLPDLLVSRQERFVLKDPLAYGGKGVALGRATPADRWSQLVEGALEQGWVVQEALESLPYLYQRGAFGCAPHDAIWGPFVFGSRYAGVMLRVQPQADQGAVNLSLTATEGLVLQV